MFNWLHRTFPQADIVALGISFGGSVDILIPLSLLVIIYGLYL